MGRNKVCQAGKFSTIAPRRYGGDDRSRRHCGALTRGMTSKIKSYLHVRRRQWRLSQKELAFLFGYRTDSIVSPYEHYERPMTLACGFACSLIFGIEAKHLFPNLFDEVEDGVVRRLYELYNRLKAGKPS